MVRNQLVCAVLGVSLFCGCGGGSKPTPKERASKDAKPAVAESDATSVAASEPQLEAVPAQSEPGDADFPRGAEAFAELVTAAQANDGEAWTKAEAKLQALGANATAALAARLDDENPVARELAAMFLAQIGPDAVSAADGLLKLLKDESTFARVNAAAALSTFEGFAERVTPVLVALLADEDTNVRITAATSLRNVSPSGRDALRALSQSLADTDSRVRAAAAVTLGELGTLATSSLASLRRLDADEDEQVRSAASRAIKQIDPTTRSAPVTIPASATE